MKHVYLFLLALGFSAQLWGQAVPNPGFENWDADTSDQLDGWYNSNLQALFAMGFPNVTPTADAHAGTAVHMESYNPPSGFLFGYISNSPDDPMLGIGGTPWATDPDSLVFWAKHDIITGDTAIGLVTFKAGGAVLSTDFFTLTGTQPVYTRYAFPLTCPSTPDSVIIAVASSNAISMSGMAAGSWLQLDDMSFTSAGTIPNGDFEAWTTRVTLDPQAWFSADDFGDTTELVTRSTDAVAGNYSAQLTSRYSIPAGRVREGFITTGQFSDTVLHGGIPYSLMTDTLCGFYKYMPSAGDSCILGAVFSQSGSIFYVAATRLAPASTWTWFEIPFALGLAPDTVRIDVWSSDPSPGHFPVDGSILMIDSLRFKSDPVTGVLTGRPAFLWSVYPNPSAGGSVMLEAASDAGTVYSAELVDLSGSTLRVWQIQGRGGFVRQSLDLSGVPAGLYVLTLRSGTQRSSTRLVLE